MQAVSDAWKNNQELNFVSESFVEITLNVGDPESQADGSVTDNGQMDFSNSGDLNNGINRYPKRFATLESNIWLLDGLSPILPDGGPYDNEGYIGNVLSNDNGVYDGLIPTITITFSKVYEELIPGITIVWGTAYEEYAKRYKIYAYANNVLTYEGEFQNSSITSVANANIDNYDKIVIEVLEWCLPHRRPRIESVLIGIRKTYSKKDIMNLEHVIFVDPLSFSLPKTEVSFKIKNLNGEYNPDNPQGVEQYLMERQKITVNYGYNLGGIKEWIQGAAVYMSEWDTPQNGIEAGLVARDSLEYMTDLYSGTSSGSLMDIAVSALTQANIPKLSDGTDPWYVSEALSSVVAPPNVDLSQNEIREVLQLVANAGCCVFYVDRTGITHIEPINSDVTDYQINRFNGYKNSEVTLTKQLKSVNVNNGQYILSVGAVGETQRVDNPLISDAQAPVVAKWVADYLVNRKLFSGEFRADPRLDALDRIINKNQFSENVVLVSEVRLTYNGAFKGSYDGRAGV